MSSRIFSKDLSRTHAHTHTHARARAQTILIYHNCIKIYNNLNKKCIAYD